MSCIIEKEPTTTRGSLVCYRLCVYASGSLITDRLNCFTLIKFSCLHFGQNNGKLISSVGAGDSMVAGIVYGISNNLNIIDSYKYAIASGSSTACSEGLTTFENMNKFLE